MTPIITVSKKKKMSFCSKTGQHRSSIHHRYNFTYSVNKLLDFLLPIHSAVLNTIAILTRNYIESL